MRGYSRKSRIGATEAAVLYKIARLLATRGQTQRELALWLGHHETWLSKILNQERGLAIKDFDRIAEFFGLTVPQLVSPEHLGEERRKTDVRRTGNDRRTRVDRRAGGGPKL